MLTDTEPRVQTARDVSLTRREVAILQALADCGSQVLAARAIGIALSTIHARMKLIRITLRAKTATHAVALAYGRGWVK